MRIILMNSVHMNRKAIFWMLHVIVVHFLQNLSWAHGACTFRVPKFYLFLCHFKDIAVGSLTYKEPTKLLFYSTVGVRPWQGRVKGNMVICLCLFLSYTYTIMMAHVYLYFHFVGPHLPLPFTPLTGNSHFNWYNTLYMWITLYHTTY